MVELHYDADGCIDCRAKDAEIERLRKGRPAGEFDELHRLEQEACSEITGAEMKQLTALVDKATWTIGFLRERIMQQNVIYGKLRERRASRGGGDAK